MGYPQTTQTRNKKVSLIQDIMNDMEKDSLDDESQAAYIGVSLDTLRKYRRGGVPLRSLDDLEDLRSRYRRGDHRTWQDFTASGRRVEGSKKTAQTGLSDDQNLAITIMLLDGLSRKHLPAVQQALTSRMMA